jgi:hypothetical protein
MKKVTKSAKNNKLANYSAMAGAVLVSGAVDAQITYVDVNPDAVVNGTNSPYNLDFNNDANPDVVFGVQAVNSAGTYSYMGIPFTFTVQGNGAGAQAGSNAAIVGSITGSSSTFVPTMLINQDVISPTQQFGSGGTLGFAGLLDVPAFGYNDYPVTQGMWLGATDKFLGVRFTNGADLHYGWVRLDVAGDATTITIKDYAFNAQPNGSIIAGQMVGLEGVSAEQKVTIKPQLDQATINVTPDLIGGKIALVDMSGRDAKVVDITDINTVISYDKLQTGVYILTARFQNESVTKKVYVK